MGKAGREIQARLTSAIIGALLLLATALPGAVRAGPAETSDETPAESSDDTPVEQDEQATK